MPRDTRNVETLWFVLQHALDLGLGPQVVQGVDVEFVDEGRGAGGGDLGEHCAAEEVVAAEDGVGCGGGVAAHFAEVGDAFDGDEGGRREVGGCVGGEVEGWGGRGVGLGRRGRCFGRAVDGFFHDVGHGESTGRSRWLTLVE